MEGCHWVEGNHSAQEVQLIGAANRCSQGAHRVLTKYSQSLHVATTQNSCLEDNVKARMLSTIKAPIKLHLWSGFEAGFEGGLGMDL